MLDLKNIELSDLIDLLAEQTAYHTSIRTVAGEQQIRISMEILKELQKEIELRKSDRLNTSEDIIPPLIQETL